MVEPETRRLLLRPLQAVGVDAFVAYRRDPEVTPYQSWRETYRARTLTAS